LNPLSPRQVPTRHSPKIGVSSSIPTIGGEDACIVAAKPGVDISVNYGWRTDHTGGYSQAHRVRRISNASAPDRHLRRTRGTASLRRRRLGVGVSLACQNQRLLGRRPLRLRWPRRPRLL